ncbi:MAG: hypothetical protein K1V96_04140 [Lachnospiraceae bacterium]
MANMNIPITKIHSYNVSVAADVGINAAVIFYNICYWVEENYANRRNFKNGKYWTYNTNKAFQAIFPEMTGKQIEYALKKLKDGGYIESAILSEDAKDRTNWYTVCDFEKWILYEQKEEAISEHSEMVSKNSEMVSEHSEMVSEHSEMFNIYNNKNTDTDKKQTNKKQTNNSHNNTLSVERAESVPKKQKSSQIKANRKKEARELFEKLWSLYPLKKGKASVSDTQKSKLLTIGYEELERAISRYIQYVDSVDYLHYKNGSTFFNSGYIDYLDANYVPEKEKKKEKKNTFQNFPQRNYDYEELERKLLLS